MSMSGQTEMSIPRLKKLLTLLERRTRTSSRERIRSDQNSYNNLSNVHSNLLKMSNNKRLVNVSKILYLGYLVKNSGVSFPTATKVTIVPSEVGSSPDSLDILNQSTSNSTSNSTSPTLCSPGQLSRRNSVQSFGKKVKETAFGSTRYGSDSAVEAPTSPSSHTSSAVPLTTTATRERQQPILKIWAHSYTKFEIQLLQSLESIISVFDNFIIFQSFFKNSKLSGKFEILEKLIKNLSKFYLIIVIINLKNLILKLIKINKLIRYAELESSLLTSPNSHVYKLASLEQSDQIGVSGNDHQANQKVETNQDLKNPNHERLVLLYTEKFKTFLEIIGYSNELILNLNLIYPSYQLPNLLDKLVNVISWVISFYRLSKDDADEAATDKKLSVIAEEYGV